MFKGGQYGVAEQVNASLRLGEAKALEVVWYLIVGG
jgi:hypothetical protein